MSKGLRAAAAAMLLVAGLAVAGCGSDDSDSTSPSDTTAAVSGETVEIKMGDFYFDPQDAEATAGTVAISAPNEGDVEHELVLFKTNMDPAELPTDSNGEVDEEKLAGEAEEVGELEVEPGETGSGEFEMTPGKYVMFCNLPAHYTQGMYGSVTVK